LGGDVRTIATGGLAPVVLDSCRLVKQFEPHLTLEGLRLIFERNFEGDGP
jgi:type III pantothenate kinase